MKSCGDDRTYTLGRLIANDVYDLVERVPKAFEKMYANSGSLYTLPAKDFKKISSFNELVSDQEVGIIQEERIENDFEKLNEYEKEGFIRIYRYPNRPERIPKNDEDIILKAMKFVKRRNSPMLLRPFLFLHPDRLDDINCRLKNDGFTERFSKTDLLHFFGGYVHQQRKNPQIELFIESAYLMLVQTYPEFTEQLYFILQEPMQHDDNFVEL